MIIPEMLAAVLNMLLAIETALGYPLAR